MDNNTQQATPMRRPLTPATAPIGTPTATPPPAARGRRSTPGAAAARRRWPLPLRVAR
ncbi:hypothetical protein [Prevotellamassilia timonensis]|uniref:hypothetical protein n=1 Tax=Prevotellamassilia timonensis TaxID=1852370 RepID=UPI0012B5D7DA|nr:hypothetical protein [Prevotellamassilia timonensis]